jgi:excisionase family DNA binding protein
MNYSTAKAATPRLYRVKPRAWRVNDFCEAHGISRSKLYELAKKHEIRLIKIGGRTLVPDSESDRLLEGGC